MARYGIVEWVKNRSKFINFKHFYFWKRYFFQDIKMFIIWNQVMCIGTDSTINKFIVIRIDID